MEGSAGYQLYISLYFSEKAGSHPQPTQLGYTQLKAYRTFIHLLTGTVKPSRQETVLVLSPRLNPEMTAFWAPKEVFGWKTVGYIICLVPSPTSGHTVCPAMSEESSSSCSVSTRNVEPQLPFLPANDPPPIHLCSFFSLF